METRSFIAYIYKFFIVCHLSPDIFCIVYKYLAIMVHTTLFYVLYLYYEILNYLHFQLSNRLCFFISFTVYSPAFPFAHLSLSQCGKAV